MGGEQVPGFGFEEPTIYKVVTFASRSLPGKGNRSGVRIIYAFYVKALKVEYVEIYYKGDKETEDRERMKRHHGTPKIKEDDDVGK